MIWLPNNPSVRVHVNEVIDPTLSTLVEFDVFQRRPDTTGHFWSSEGKESLKKPSGSIWHVVVMF